MKIKSSKNDFTPSSLPLTRRKQLARLIKYRYRTLLASGAALTLGALPLLVASFFLTFFVVSVYSNPSYCVDGSLNEAGIEAFRSGWTFYTVGISASLLVFFVVLSGITEVMRSLCWDEPGIFNQLVLKGIKQNVASFLSQGLIFSLFVFVDLFIEANLPDILWVVFSKAVLFGLVLPFVLMNLLYNSFYTGKWQDRLSNIVVLWLHNLPALIGLSLLVGALASLHFLPYSLLWVRTLILAVAVFVFSPLLLLSLVEFACYVFDKDYNQKFHKELYRKGLYSEEE